MTILPKQSEIWNNKNNNNNSNNNDINIKHIQT